MKRLLHHLADHVWAALDDVLCLASMCGFKPPWYEEWYARKPWPQEDR